MRLTGILAGMTLITLIMFLVGFLWCMIQAAKVEPLVPWVTLLGVLNLLLLNCFVGVELHSTPQCKVKICPTVTGKRMVTVLSTRDRLKRTISSHRHRRMVHDKKVFNHRMKKLVTPLTRRYGRRKPPKNGPYRRRWAPPVPPNHDPKPVNHNIQLPSRSRRKKHKYKRVTRTHRTRKPKHVVRTKLQNHTKAYHAWHSAANFEIRKLIGGNVFEPLQDEATSLHQLYLKDAHQRGILRYHLMWLGRSKASLEVHLTAQKCAAALSQTSTASLAPWHAPR